MAPSRIRNLSAKLGGVLGASLVVAAYFTWVAWDTLLVAADNARLVSVFQADEYTHLVLLRDALSDGTFYLRFPYYGHSYFNAVLLPLSALAQIMPVGETAIIVALRLGSLIPAALTVLLTFVLAERYWSRGVAWLASIGMMLVNSPLTHWAVTSHPDSLQTLAIVAALYCTCRFVEGREHAWQDRAAALAGLAFATKYGGVLLLPLVVAAGFFVEGDLERARTRAIQALRLMSGIAGSVGLIMTLYEPWTAHRFDQHMSLRLILRGGCVALVAVGALAPFWRGVMRLWRLPGWALAGARSVALFVTAFVLASPFSLVDLGFIRGMLAQSRQAKRGYFFDATGNPADWLGILARPGVVGLLGMGLAGTGLALLVRDARFNRGAPILPRVTLAAWSLGTMAFLMLRVNDRVDRYLLLVIPALFIFAADAAARLWAWAKAGTGNRLVRWIALAGIALAILNEGRLGLARQAEFVGGRASLVQTSDAVRAGRWMLSNVPRDSRVLYDFYSYVPPEFAAARASWGMTAAEVEEVGAEVVVVNDRIRSRYASAADSARFQWGPTAFLPVHEFYGDLERGALAFAPVFRTGGITIYRRRGAGG